MHGSHTPMGSLLAGFFGRFLGFRGACLITTVSVFTSFVMSCIAFYEVILHQPHTSNSSKS